MGGESYLSVHIILFIGFYFDVFGKGIYNTDPNITLLGTVSPPLLTELFLRGKRPTLWTKTVTLTALLHGHVIGLI